MKSVAMILAIVGLAALMPPADRPAAQTVPPQATESAPVYKPPARGVPGGRVGGATRSAVAEIPVVLALAPNHTGLTLEEQPTLYWFLSKPTTLPIELTVIEATSVAPVLEVRIPQPQQPGVQRIRLADHGTRLSPGVTYKWYVAVVPDPNYRSRDIVAGGMIERVATASAPVEKLPAGGADAPRRYAEAGVWYDALASISQLIETQPANRTLREHRAAMLEQVGLPQVAEYERRLAASPGG